MHSADDDRKWYFETQRASDGHHVQDGILYDTREDAMRRFDGYASVEAYAKANGWRKVTIGHQGKRGEFPGFPEYEVLYDAGTDR